MIDDAIAALQARFETQRSVLEQLVGVAGISASSFPAGEVRRSAEAVAETLIAAGLAGVELLESGGHPAVYAEANASADSPTVLIYGHHDVQPPGRRERWVSPPFQAEVRDGRIYGRGTADDKGGFLACLAAIEACLAADSLPCNVKLLVEGEEEIGSPNLSALLEKERGRFASEFIVLCDTPNFATGVPALTHTLRGNCIVDVEVACLQRPVHSGQAGGFAPDAIMILCTILAGLTRSDGTLAIDGLQERIHVDQGRAAALRLLPRGTESLRHDFGFLDGVRPLAEEPGDTHPGASSPYERLWAQPSLTVTAIEAVPVAQAANQIADRARARLSIRTVRDLDSETAGALVAAAIEGAATHGARVTTTVLGGPEWWEADPRHPIFAVAREALGRGFGRDAVMIGSGGSIGFVRPFSDLAGTVPPLLIGVQDPRSNAHSENESMDLEDWHKAMVSTVYLLDGLSRWS